jgi:beta-xylosidase
MLTQRTFGPKCSGSVCLDVTNLKDGDVAGLALLAGQFGYIGVKKDGGKNFITVVDNQPVDSLKGVQHEVESTAVDVNTIYLKADCYFKDRADTANFFYSVDGIEWKQLGGKLQMVYRLDHFMGQRFALFNYSTKEEGGYADFDWFKISE